MSSVGGMATVTAACDRCGRRFTPNLGQLLGGGGMYCKTTCRVQAIEQRVAARQGRLCASCGGPRGRMRHYELEICLRCRAVAWRTCWRKRPLPEDPGLTDHAGTVMHAYRCPLCRQWHLTSRPDDMLPADFTARLNMVATLIDATGFDIDTHRKRTPPSEKEQQ